MFNEAERRIFGPFFNGSQMVYADPLRIYRRLQQALEGEVNKYIRQSQSNDANAALQAKERLLAAGLYALEMTPFDPQTGQGSLEQDVRAALRAYLGFMLEKKEPGGSWPACCPPTPPLPAPSQHSTTLPGFPSGAIFPPSTPNGLGR